MSNVLIVLPSTVTQWSKAVKLKLSAQYPDDYPDALPALVLEIVEGDVDELDKDSLLQDMRKIVSR